MTIVFETMYGYSSDFQDKNYNFDQIWFFRTEFIVILGVWTKKRHYDETNSPNSDFRSKNYNFDHIRFFEEGFYLSLRVCAR